MFVTKIRADSTDDRSPWGDFFFAPLGGKTAAGLPVTPDSAVTLAAVYRAVSLISGHMALLPLVLKRAGTNKRVTNHAVQQLFKRPNAWQNGFDWRRFLVVCLLLRGNSYCEIIDDPRGRILALNPLHPDAVTTERLTSGDYRFKVKSPDGTTRTLTRDRVWHLRGLSLDGITGLSVIAVARESLSTGLAAQAYGNRYFANDARPSSGWLSHPGKFADTATKTAFRDSVKEAQSAANRGKMMVLEHGIEYHDVAVSNADAQFLESRKFSVDDVARWFGVPPHKLASLDRATFSNIEQQSLEYVNDGLLIWAHVIEAGIEAELLFESENLEPELDFARLLRGDSTARYTNHQSGINAGWLTRNEAREAEGREPLDGLDEPLRPLNMVEEGEAEDAVEDQEEAEPPEQEPDDPPDPNPEEKGAARLHALLHANASRMARRIVKAGRLDNAALLAEALAIPEAKAENWGRRTPFTAETFTEKGITASLVALALES
jgi:HK97 family phage portal protein